jgi:hypothetical protein
LLVCGAREKLDSVVRGEKKIKTPITLNTPYELKRSKQREREREFVNLKRSKLDSAGLVGVI